MGCHWHTGGSQRDVEREIRDSPRGTRRWSGREGGGLVRTDKNSKREYGRG